MLLACQSIVQGHVRHNEPLLSDHRVWRIHSTVVGEVLDMTVALQLDLHILYCDADLSTHDDLLEPQLGVRSLENRLLERHPLLDLTVGVRHDLPSLVGHGDVDLYATEGCGKHGGADDLAESRCDFRQRHRAQLRGLDDRRVDEPVVRRLRPGVILREGDGESAHLGVVAHAVGFLLPLLLPCGRPGIADGPALEASDGQSCSVARRASAVGLCGRGEAGRICLAVAVVLNREAQGAVWQLCDADPDVLGAIPDAVHEFLAGEEEGEREDVVLDVCGSNEALSALGHLGKGRHVELKGLRF